MKKSLTLPLFLKTNPIKIDQNKESRINIKDSTEEYAIFKKLKEINWDFSNAKTNTFTNAIHPYPAKFIPQIPRAFIENLTHPNETVYDPFLGSGTTAVEANVLGRNAIGNDVNELAVLISKVKTTPLSVKRLNQLECFIQITKTKIASYYSDSSKGISKPNIINLDLWFKDFVIAEISIIKEQILKLKDKDLVDLCLIALSGIIVNVSNQDSDTRYVRVEKNLSNYDTFRRFERQLTKIKIIILSCFQELSKGKSELIVADSRISEIFPNNSAHFSITSPPYPNAYDYHLYHKYRLLWLGMNPIALRKTEIGAHADYSKKNGSTEFDFKNDMEKCFYTTSGILKPNSYFVLVIGNSIIKGKAINNDEILRDAAKNTPFVFIDEFSRVLNPRKKSFNPAIGNIKTEKILVFKNLK